MKNIWIHRSWLLPPDHQLVQHPTIPASTELVASGAFSWSVLSECIYTLKSTATFSGFGTTGPSQTAKCLPVRTLSEDSARRHPFCKGGTQQFLHHHPCIVFWIHWTSVPSPSPLSDYQSTLLSESVRHTRHQETKALDHPNHNVSAYLSITETETQILVGQWKQCNGPWFNGMVLANAQIIPETQKTPPVKLSGTLQNKWTTHDKYQHISTSSFEELRTVAEICVFLFVIMIVVPWFQTSAAQFVSAKTMN